MKQPIVLIEDDKWLADSLVSSLNSHGYDVTQFASAHEAMTWIDQNHPALIIADVLLGDHNTFTLFHELQSYPDTASIPIIVCTSLDRSHLASIDQQSYGIVEVLDKTTLTPDQLLLTVEAHLPEERGLER